MEKMAVSRAINRLTGGHPDEMFCARCYFEGKIYGGFWLPLGATIDVCFYIIRRQRQHVRATYLLQRRIDNAKSQRSATASPQEQAGEVPPQSSPVSPLGT